MEDEIETEFTADEVRKELKEAFADVSNPFDNPDVPLDVEFLKSERESLFRLSGADLHYALPQLLAYQLGESPRDLYARTDEIVEQLDALDLSHAAEPNPKIAECNRMIADHLQHEYRSFTPRQSYAVWMWLMHVRNWWALQARRECLESALVYWGRKAGIPNPVPADLSGAIAEYLNGD